MLTTRNREYLYWAIFIGLVLVGITIRIWLASRLDAHIDIVRWEITAFRVDDGQSIYRNHYNYSPLWAFCMFALKRTLVLFNLVSFKAFQMGVVSLLTLVDLAVMAVIFRVFNRWLALAFFLNPITISITAIFGQFDLLALLCCWLGWLLLQKHRDSLTWAQTSVSTALLTLSLLFKHVFFFFPFWLLFCPDIGSWKKRLTVSLTPYILFFSSFIPYLFIENGWVKIQKQVFEYQPAGGANGFLHHLMQAVIIPSNFVDWLNKGDVVSYKLISKTVFIVAMIVFGIWVMRKAREAAFYYYPLALITFTSGLWIYHLASAMVSVCYFWRRWPVWIFVGYCLYFSVLAFYRYGLKDKSVFNVHHILLCGIFWIGVMLVQDVLFTPKRPSTVNPVEKEAASATGFVVQ